MRGWYLKTDADDRIEEIDERLDSEPPFRM